MRHSRTGGANGGKGVSAGFTHHAVRGMGGVSEKQKAALCQSQGAQSQTSCVTVMCLGHDVNFLPPRDIEQAVYSSDHVSKK